MSIQKYQAFLKVVEYGSLTRAAEVLNYSQSGISRIIGDLEREWKLSLLQRRHDGVQLTADGRRLLPYIKRVCQEYQNLQMQVDDVNGLKTGFIRIGVFSSVATHWLPNIIKEFQKDYPTIGYELLLGDYEEIESWLLEAKVDCGFLRLPAHASLETIFLEREPLMAILPEDHPLASLDKVPLKALEDEPFLLQEKGTNSEIAEALNHFHFKPKVRFTTWDDYAIMSMVESGLGVSILSKLILKRIPYRIAMKELDVLAYRDIGIAFQSRKHASVAVKRFLEYLKYRDPVHEEQE